MDIFEEYGVSRYIERSLQLKKTWLKNVIKELRQNALKSMHCRHSGLGVIIKQVVPGNLIEYILWNIG